MTRILTFVPATVLLGSISLGILLCLFASQTSASDSLRIVSQNMHRFFDNIDNGNKRETILSTRKFQAKIRLTAHKIITEFELPDIIAVQEVENLNTLNLLIQHIQQSTKLRYHAILREGNDVSGMNVGFLIQSKYRVTSINQLFKTNKLKLDKSPLFSRPPLLVQVCEQLNCISIINLHLRSMRGIRKKSSKQRVNAKRLEQASVIARWIDQYQRSHPDNSIIVLGDFNALTPSDRYVDVVGTIKGNPDNRITQFKTRDWIQKDLIDATKRVSLRNRYSYIYHKKKQILDYMLISSNFESSLKHIRFSQIDYRFSDHAGLIADFSW